MQPHRELTISDTPALGFASAGVFGSAMSLFLAADPVALLCLAAGLAIAALGALFLVRRRWVGTLLGLAAIADVVCFRGSTDMARGEREHFVQHNPDTAIVSCRGVVVWRDEVRQTSRSEHFWLEDVRVQFADTVVEFRNTRVRLSVPSMRAGDIEIGNVVACDARFESAHAIQTRSVRELCWTLRERLAATARLHDEESLIVVRGNSPVRYTLHRLRESVFDVFEQHLQPDSRAVAGALLLGSRTAFSSEFRTDMQITGLAHLFALSGLNTGLLVSLCWLLMGWLRIPRQLRYLLLLLLLVFYTALGLGVPSLFRSAVMAGLLILSRLLARPSHPINLLLFAAGVELLFWPLHILDAGFLLSYLSMAGILTAYLALHKPLQDLLYSRGQSLRIRTVDTLSSTIGAQLATAPVAALLFGRVPGVAIVANVIAIPLFSLLVVLILCLLSLDQVSQFAASAIARSIEALVGLFSGLTSGAASFVGASFSTTAAIAWSITAILLQSIAIIQALIGRNKSAVLLTLLALNLLIWPAQIKDSADARVSVWGVRGYESLYMCVGDFNCLIGSGPDWLSERTEMSLADELGRDGLTSLDVLIVDSRIATKIGGAPKVIEIARPSLIVDLSAPRETLTSARLDAAVLLCESEFVRGEVGMTWAKAETEFRVTSVESLHGETVWECKIESRDAIVLVQSDAITSPIFDRQTCVVSTASMGDTPSWSLRDGMWTEELRTSRQLMRLWSLPGGARV